jgi:hypothetical protein
MARKSNIAPQKLSNSEPQRSTIHDIKTSSMGHSQNEKWSTTGLITVILSLTVLTLITYHNIYSVEFIFDSRQYILFYPPVHKLWPPDYLFQSARPIPFITFALNYALTQEQIWSYQLVNVVTHITNGILLFIIVDQTIRYSPYCSNSLKSDAWWISLFVSLLWLVHPLQTQAVTYTVQRQESLACTFYLLAIFCFVKQSVSRYLFWKFATFIAVLFGMLSKEFVITAPFLILWFDWAFFHRSLSDLWKANGKLHISLWLTSIAPLLIIWSLRDAYASAGLGVAYNTTWWQYAITQPSVITQYLRLVVWPDQLVMDPGWPWRLSLWASAPEWLPFLMMIGGLIYLACRIPTLGFVALAWIVILSPTSSIVKIVDNYFEHRMYMPLAFISLLFVIGVRALFIWAMKQDHHPNITNWLIRLRTMLLVGIISSLAIATNLRNQVYATSEGFWTDNLQKYPDSFRPRSVLALSLLARGESIAAAEHAARLVRSFPDFAGSYSTFGLCLMSLGEYQDAAIMFRKAIEIDPSNALNMTHLGEALLVSDPPQSIPILELSARMQPNHALTQYTLGKAYFAVEKNVQKAREHLFHALELPGPKTGCLELLGDIASSEGRFAQAVEYYSLAIEDKTRAAALASKLEAAKRNLKDL